MPTVSRSEVHRLKKSNTHYKDFDTLCGYAKDLYNQGNYYIRQAFFISRDLRNNKKLSGEQESTLEEINEALKDYGKQKKNKNKIVLPVSATNSHLSYEFLVYYLKGFDCYKTLPAQTSEKVINALCQNWRGYYGAMKSYKSDKSTFSSLPKLPKYKNKDTGRVQITLTNQQCRVLDGNLVFPKSLGLKPYKVKTTKKLLHVSIVPYYKHLDIVLTYQIVTPELKPDNKKYLGIDIGASNLAALVTNLDLSPILITGKGLFHNNAKYSELVAKTKTKAKKVNNRYYTNLIDSLTVNNVSKTRDYIHKASRYIISYALANDIHTIVIGYNDNIKRTAMSKKNVQDLPLEEQIARKKARKTYVPIPHLQLIHMIQYKAEEVGIKVILTEEGYTSGTSFLDSELPTQEFYNKERRVKRGLFVSNTGVRINADVNGALQILKKVFPELTTFHKEYLNPVRVNADFKHLPRCPKRTMGVA